MKTNSTRTISDDEEAMTATLVTLDAVKNEEPTVTVSQGDDTPTSEAMSRFQELETIIARGMDAFMEVGKALVEIQAKRLYRPEFSSFEEYCHKRWKFSRQYGYRLIEAAKAMDDVSPIGDSPLPQSEGAIRPLTTLRSKEDRVEALRIAGEKKKKKKRTAPTAKDMQEAVEEVKAAKPEVYRETAATKAEEGESAESDPIIDVPAEYPCKKYPTFQQMWEWAKTVKATLDLETADIKVVNGINSLVSSLYLYTSWERDAKGCEQMAS